MRGSAGRSERRSVLTTLHPNRRRYVIFLLAVSSLLGGCGISRPDHAVAAEVAGIITSVAHRGSETAIEVGDAQMVIPGDAIDLSGPGLVESRLVLYGHADGASWYLTAPSGASGAGSECYRVLAPAAFDEPGAVVLVFVDLKSVGIRLPKASTFTPPSPYELPSSGEYQIGGGGRGAAFCLNSTGEVASAR